MSNIPREKCLPRHSSSSRFEQDRYDLNQHRARFEMVLVRIQHEFIMLQLEIQNAMGMARHHARDRALMETRIHQIMHQNEALVRQNEILAKKIRELESELDKKASAGG